MTVTTISSTTSDTYSSPYYDYATGADALYVGDDASHLYKVTGIFDGTGPPAVTSVTLPNTPYYVALPVYDQGSGCVFVGDSGGYLNKVNSGVAGTFCTSTTFSTKFASEQIGTSAGIYDAPLMDSTNGTIYAFVTDTSITGCSGNCIVQYLTSFTSGSAPHGEESIGNGEFYYYLWDGTFDNVYYSSSSGTGNLYAVGNTSFNPGKFYGVPITSNTLGTPTVITTVGGNQHEALWASPVTEFCNPGAGSCAVSSGITQSPSVDYVYFSGYEVNVGTGGCSNQGVGQGCVLSYNVSDPGSVSNVAQLEVTFPTGGVDNDKGCWGTSGFVIDNGSSDTGASNIYFLSLNGNSASGDNGECYIGTGDTVMAVQASQSEL